MVEYHVQPIRKLQGSVDNLPGDKSISHRVLIIGAIAEGVTTAYRLLLARDTLATIQALRQLGVKIAVKQDSAIIQGVGLAGLKQPHGTINVDNSATTIRLLTGLLAGANKLALLTGDDSLQQRPMSRVATPLQAMEAAIELTDDEHAPIKLVARKNKLQGITYTLPVASAQVKSAILLAGLYAQEATTIIEPVSSRDHTELLLQAYGAQIKRQNQEITIMPRPTLTGMEITVPSDLSSAAFFIVAATVIKNAEITLRHVGINPTRSGLLRILEAMGANIIIHNEQLQHGEPVADITVHSAHLQGIEIPVEWVVPAIDEFPILFVAAACAQGKTILREAQELRYKESDRIKAMAEGLQVLGIQVNELPNGLVIHGGQLQGGEIDSKGDHRVAMAFTIAGALAQAPVIVKDCANVSTSFPNFIAIATQLGFIIEVKES